jgi:hypothetical protein
MRPIDDMIQDEDYQLDNWNRTPEKKELEACRPHIEEIVESEQPHGIVYLGKVAESYKTRLPKLSLHHPAYISRMEYKLLPVKKEALKLTRFIDQLNKKD